MSQLPTAVKPMMLICLIPFCWLCPHHATTVWMFLKHRVQYLAPKKEFSVFIWRMRWDMVVTWRLESKVPVKRSGMIIKKYAKKRISTWVDQNVHFRGSVWTESKQLVHAYALLIFQAAPKWNWVPVSPCEFTAQLQETVCWPREDGTLGPDLLILLKLGRNELLLHALWPSPLSGSLFVK